VLLLVKQSLVWREFDSVAGHFPIAAGVRVHRHCERQRDRKDELPGENRRLGQRGPQKALMPAIRSVAVVPVKYTCAKETIWPVLSHH
jgi:hypothetical protein